MWCILVYSYQLVLVGLPHWSTVLQVSGHIPDTPHAPVVHGLTLLALFDPCAAAIHANTVTTRAAAMINKTVRLHFIFLSNKDHREKV